MPGITLTCDQVKLARAVFLGTCLLSQNDQIAAVYSDIHNIRTDFSTPVDPVWYAPLKIIYDEIQLLPARQRRIRSNARLTHRILNNLP